MTSQLPTRRELEALKVLWQQGQCSVREIYQQICPDGQEMAYTTVLSLIQTMEKKGLVTRETEGRGKTHVYSALLRSEPTLRNLAADFLDTVFGGAVDQYLVRALEAREVSAKEIEEMEQLLAAAKARQGQDAEHETDGSGSE